MPTPKPRHSSKCEGFGRLGHAEQDGPKGHGISDNRGLSSAQQFNPKRTGNVPKCNVQQSGEGNFSPLTCWPAKVIFE